jgi:hypothetical protein
MIKSGLVSIGGLVIEITYGVQGEGTLITRVKVKHCREATSSHLLLIISSPFIHNKFLSNIDEGLGMKSLQDSIIEGALD